MCAGGSERFGDQGLLGETREAIGLKNKDAACGVNHKIAPRVIRETERLMRAHRHILQGMFGSLIKTPRAELLRDAPVLCLIVKKRPLLGRHNLDRKERIDIIAAVLKIGRASCRER